MVETFAPDKISETSGTASTVAGSTAASGLEVESLEVVSLEVVSLEVESAEPRSMEPRSMEPRSVEPRSMEPRSMEPRSAESAESASTKTASTATENTAFCPATVLQKPLTVPNLASTLWLGLVVLCGEWRWLISDAWYRRKEKKLLAELARLPQGPDADRVHATLINQRSLHHGMRQAQIISREAYLNSRS